MAHRFPALIADPAPAEGRLWLTNARLFDGTGAPVREGAAVLVEDGVIRHVGDGSQPRPDGAREEPDELVRKRLVAVQQRDDPEGGARRRSYLSMDRDPQFLAVGERRDVDRLVRGIGCSWNRSLSHGEAPAGPPR